MPGSNFFKELKRRNVYKVAITYAIVAWLILQVASIVLPTFEAPLWMMKVLTFVLIIGFPVALILAWAFEMSPEGIIRTKDAGVEDNQYQKNKKRMSVGNILIGVLLLIIAGQFIYNKYGDKGVDVANTEKSIAVLPFKNMSTNEENQHFCDGMMEDILNHLAKVPDLHVVSRTSIEKYRDNLPSSVIIGEELNVNYILEGSVQRYGDQARIFAQLIHAPTDKHLWSQDYNRELKEIFTIQAEVTQSIAKKILAEISPAVKARIDKVPTVNMEAYDLYLQARAVLLEGYMTDFTAFRKTGYHKAMELINKALQLEPKFSRALSLKAGIYSGYNWEQEWFQPTFLDSVKIWCEEALEYDPENDHALRLLGNYYRNHNQMDRNFDYLNKALELNPNSIESMLALSSYYYSKNDFIKAISLRTRAILLDPHNPYNNTRIGFLAWLYLSIGDFEKAEALCKHILKKVHPTSVDATATYWTLQHLYAIQGKSEEAFPILEKYKAMDDIAIKLFGNLYSIVLRDYEKAIEFYNQLDIPDLAIHDDFKQRMGFAYLASGQVEKGKSLLESYLQERALEKNLNRISRIGYSYDIAGVYATLGEKDKAYQYLEDWLNYQVWLGLHALIKIDPFFDSLRGEERFENIVYQMDEKVRKVREEIWRMEREGEIPSVL